MLMKLQVVNPRGVEVCVLVIASARIRGTQFTSDTLGTLKYQAHNS